MPYCPTCGNKESEEASYCSNCGEALSGEVSQDSSGGVLGFLGSEENNELKNIRKELEKNRSELEKVEKETQTRSVLNPLYWIGVCTITIGILFCITLIGLPIGWPLVAAGKKMMFKNPPNI